jgi:hypothetical protein
VRTRKPTGDAECPPEILRAHEIEHKIQSKVACRDLEDGEIADFEDSNFPDNSDDNMSDSYDPPEDTDEGPAPNSNPAPRVHQQHSNKLIFYVAFSFFSVAYLPIITIFGRPTFFYSPHSLYKYILFSFFHLFLQKATEKRQISFLQRC